MARVTSPDPLESGRHMGFWWKPDGLAQALETCVAIYVRV